MDRVIHNSPNRITNKYGGTHKGVDLGYNGKDESKNNVYANCAGIVVETVDGLGKNILYVGAKTWGNYVLVKHPNGMHTRYAHLKKGIPVKKGQSVNEKTILGVIGDSGRTFGRHLHFEVANGYSSSTRINPTSYLSKAVYEELDRAPYNLTAPLKRGSKGAAVGKLQTRLNELGITDNKGNKLKVDNSFGPLTEQAVIKFQKSKKVPNSNPKKPNYTGEVGLNTAHALSWLYKGK